MILLAHLHHGFISIWVKNLPNSFWLHNHNISLTADGSLSTPPPGQNQLHSNWCKHTGQVHMAVIHMWAWTRAVNPSSKSFKSTFFYNVAIQVIGQLVTELIQKTRSSLLWHYVLLTLQGTEIKHSFLGHSSAGNFWEEIKIRLWPSWGFILCASCMIRPLLQVLF